MTEPDLVLSWAAVLIAIVGLAMAFLRARAWWHDRTGDPLDPTLWMGRER